MSRRVVVGVAGSLAIAVAIAVHHHHADPARKEAQAACADYAKISGRDSSERNEAEHDDIVRSAVEHADRAASLDVYWIPLRADITSYLRLQGLDQLTDAQWRHVSAADWHVEADCSLAGHAIGDLLP